MLTTIESAAMTTRRIPASMLHTPNTPVRWLRTLAAVINNATAGLCCQQWQRNPAPRLQPARIASVSRLSRRVR